MTTRIKRDKKTGQPIRDKDGKVIRTKAKVSGPNDPNPDSETRTEA